MPGRGSERALSVGGLALAAAVWNLNAPTLFFDSQIMLGGSLAVFALLQFGWPGIVVGLAALAVTVLRWGHPFELLISTVFLVVLKVFLDRFRGAWEHRDDGRVLIVAVAFWLLAGMWLEILMFRSVFGLPIVASFGLGLKEAVRGIIDATFGFLLFIAVRAWSSRGGRTSLSVRGLTCALVLAAMTIPSIALLLILSRQLKEAELQAHIAEMRSFGTRAADLVRLGPPSQVDSLLAANGGMAFDIRVDGRSAVTSDPTLFATIERDYAEESPARTGLPGLGIYVPKANAPTLVTDSVAYSFTAFDVTGPSGSGVAARVTVVQPLAVMVHKLDSELLIPSFSILLGLLVSGTLASIAVAAAVGRQFDVVSPSGIPTGSADPLPGLSQSAISELNTLVSAVNERSRRVNELTASLRAAHAAEKRGREEITALIDGLPISMAINTLGRNPRITFLNRQFNRTFGYALEDIPTVAAWAERAYPDAGYRRHVFEAWDAAVQKASETNFSPDPMEFHVTCRNGDVHDIFFNVVVVGDQLVVTMLDVTDLRRTANELRVAEAKAWASTLIRERMALASRAAKAAFWDWELESNRVEWSEEMKVLFGFGPEEAGTDFDSWSVWRSVVHPGDLAAAEAESASARRKGTPLMLEYRIVLPDGRVRRIETRGDVIRNTEGVPVRIAGISQDVTERTDAEHDLALYREQLELLLAERTEERDLARRQLEKAAFELTENIPVGTYTMAQPPAGGMARFAFLSTRFLELTGLDRERVLADPLNAFACVHPEDYDDWVRKNTHVFKNKLPFHGQCRIVVDGQIRWVVAESTPRDMSDGSVVWEGVLTDISDRKRVEAELATARQREQEMEKEMRRTLEQKLKTSLSAAAVAHEINQPLSRILLRTQIDLERMPEAAHGTLRELVADAERVVQTIEKMKALLRNVETAQRPVDLTHVVISALHQLKQSMRQGAISVTHTGDERSCAVLGDEVQLLMMLTNLLRNAIEAVVHGGGSREVRIERFLHDDMVELVVGDSGPGWPGGTVDEAILSTSKPGGSGIGLYIVKTTLDNHRGTLSVGRSPLGGAEFRITIPRLSDG